MSKKLNLMLGAWGHLPSGAGEAEFEALYEKEIKPLVQALNKFPGINMVFHYSGVILYWIERRYPELFMLLEDLLSRKQAEFLGGGFFHPMMPLMPQVDKIGQIELLTTYLRRHFGKRPQGCWLAPKSWEQNMVGPLNSCGMNYTFLCDQHFAAAGLKPNEAGLFSPCVTEDQGKLITIFPIAQALGSKLHSAIQSGGAAKILTGLTEKGGATSADWPLMVFPFSSDAAPCEERALAYESFFRELAEADTNIEFTTPARVFKNLRNLKRVYFPNTCGEACCYAGSKNYPRQILAEYPEAGGIYAKMVYVHTLINNQLRGDKTRKRTALEELWKAQDSCIFSLDSASSPGLLHAPVRKAAYRSLLEAEKITREKGKFVPSLSFFDFDLDGEGEHIFQDEKLNCCVKTQGAGIFELDYLPAAWNYLDTLSIACSGPACGERRKAFVDWLAPADLPIDTCGASGIPTGYFCGCDDYEVSDTDRLRRSLCFRLPPRAGLPFGGIEIEKRWQLKKSSITLDYVLRNTGETQESFTFCPQVELSFPGDDGTRLRVLAQKDGGREGVKDGIAKETLVFDESITIKNIRGLEFQDITNEALIALETNSAFNAKIFHIRSTFNGRAAYQSTCIMPFFSVSLDGDKTWKVTFSLKISS